MEKSILEAIRLAETTIPEDVYKHLKMAYSMEENEISKSQLQSILDNVEYAREKQLPICQDTGTQTFFVDVGYDFPFKKELVNSIVNAVSKATQNYYIRPNAVDPFSGKNPGNNVGRFIPYINWFLRDGDDATINVLPKGGGSENASALAMLKPGEGIKGIKKFVIDQLVRAGANPCPPTIIGLGIGGGSDLSLIIAKRALLRPLGQRHEEKRIADLELELLDLANKTGVGTMGWGGKVSVLDVHIEYAYRHPASLPVGMVIQCWADRRSKVHIDSKGNVEVVQ
ncbi:MAG: fumarate hydratase [Thermoplasmata archaeon]|nr:fumarate hydratase [Thermoplasmata archaeon]MVT13357.1 fumarate hydratase [Euryarchaeota archaeon]